MLIGQEIVHVASEEEAIGAQRRLERSNRLVAWSLFCMHTAVLIAVVRRGVVRAAPDMNSSADTGKALPGAAADRG